MKQKTKKPATGGTSERVVVDEVFDGGLARLLRSIRKAGSKQGDYSIDTWEKEREDFIEDWRVEAFVGFEGGRKIREGDVFFIADGSLLNNDYSPIPREAARREHLLIPSDKSTEIARSEIKEEFHKLSAFHISSGKRREIDSLMKRVEENMEIERKKGR